MWRNDNTTDLVVDDLTIASSGICIRGKETRLSWWSNSSRRSSRRGDPIVIAIVVRLMMIKEGVDKFKLLWHDCLDYNVSMNKEQKVLLYTH